MGILNLQNHSMKSVKNPIHCLKILNGQLWISKIPSRFLTFSHPDISYPFLSICAEQRSLRSFVTQLCGRWSGGIPLSIQLWVPCMARLFHLLEFGELMMSCFFRALKPPGYHKEWHVGVRVSSNKKLVAFISGVPMTLRVREKWVFWFHHKAFSPKLHSRH